MHGELEKKLAEKLGGGLEEGVAGKIAEFGGLLTRRAAVLLLCRQHGIETERRIRLADAAGSALPFSFRAVVDRIFPAQEYPNGAGRSVRLHVSDAGGSVTLVLWNSQAAQVEQGGILAGDEVECTGAYFRSGEIAIGKQGIVKKVGGRPVLGVPSLTHGLCHVRGTVGEIEPDYHYVDRKTGEKRSLWSFMLCEGDACRRVVVWPSQSEPPRPQEGSHLVLENVVFKNGEIQFNSYSRMIGAGRGGERAGVLAAVSSAGKSAVFAIDGKEFSVPLEEGLALCGIRSVPAGVEPSTLLGIKASAFAGKKVRYGLRDGSLAWLALGE